MGDGVSVGASVDVGLCVSIGSGVADGAVSPAGVVTGVDFPGLEFAAAQAAPVTDPQAFPIVELQAAKLQTEASAKVVRAADDSLGTLLDVMA